MGADVRWFNIRRTDSDPVWSADGTHVLFRSNRTRTSSLWAIPVKNGRPAGDAVLVKDDVPIGTSTRPADAGHSHPLWRAVLHSGAAASERLSRGACAVMGRLPVSHGLPPITRANNDCCAAVSPDGKRLAYYSRSPRILVIRELGNGNEREFPLNLEINFLLSTGPQWFPRRPIGDGAR